LLSFTFLVEAGAGVPSGRASLAQQLVPREDLAPAIAMNSVGIKISHAWANTECSGSVAGTSKSRRLSG
jgi:hypothetical protein